MVPTIKNMYTFCIERDASGYYEKDRLALNFTSGTLDKHNSPTMAYLPIPMADGAKRLKLTYLPTNPSIVSEINAYVNFEYTNGVSSPSSINPSYIDLYPVSGSDVNLIGIAGVTTRDSNFLVSIEMFKI